MFPSGHNPILTTSIHWFWLLLPVFLLYGVISRPDRLFFFLIAYLWLGKKSILYLVVSTLSFAS